MSRFLLPTERESAMIRPLISYARFCARID